MTAAARGAAGWLAMQRRDTKTNQVKPKAGEVRAFARTLQERYGLSAARAWDLAEEQAQKQFTRSRA